MSRPPTTLVVLVTTALLLGSCREADDRAVERADPAPTTGTATSTTVVAPTTVAPPVEPIRWEPCASAECATVSVPRDHDEPGGERIELFTRRLPATGERIGALFFNFGGPGAGAADLVSAFPVPAGIRERFDIVGMDPRGVGRSTPVDCGVEPTTLYSVDHTIEDDDDVRALLEISRRYADDCASAHGDLLAHLGTRDVARDMDHVRAAMGDEQLSYVGYSYGTSIGQAYAELFPGRVRAMVLDGVVDPAGSGVEIAIEQALGFERALANWADGCPSRATCPFGADALGAVDRVLASAEEGVPSTRGRTLGPGEAAVALAYPLYQAALWGRLDAAIAAALDGDGAAMVDLADGYMDLVDFSVYFAVSCLDAPWPRSTDEHLARADAAAAEAPRFGEAIVNDYVRCAVWPADPDPLGAVRAELAPPILVVSTTGDPATPYENGVAVADRLATGVLLTHEGEGHTIVFQGSGCVDDVVAAYLIDLEVPAPGGRC